ncbi:hypothetical protein ACIA5D_45225 [Actinoplanes sp. NPDC051513]|uniref:hypothetical protein n=1 Tax=Actinoplanes sp. NPDC051513 TaxID=3363908 RepID=UPI003793C06D
MTLYVETDGLTAAERMVRSAADDVIAARNHFEDNGKIVWILDGIINIVQDESNRIRWSVLAFLNNAGQNALPAAADAITDARNYYARTDQAGAEKIDATMPGVNVAAESKDAPAPQPGPNNRDLIPLHDVREPRGRLGHVSFDDSAYGLDYQPKWHDMISPAASLRTAIYEVTELASKIGMCDRAYDPYEVVLKPICGDWAGMARLGHVLNQLEWCLRDVATNLAWTAQGIRSVWMGNAGDAASAYFFKMAKTLDTSASTLDGLGKMYSEAARGAFDLAETIGSLLSGIADAAIFAAAAGATAGGSAATGIGLPLAALAAIGGAAEVARVVHDVIQIIDYVAKFDTLTSTLKSSLQHFGEVDGEFPVPELPPVPPVPR